MIDLILLGVLGAVTWFVASEGAWSAGVTFLSVVIAGLLAMNFFEPAAALLGSNLPAYDSKMDMVALVGIFALSVFLLRLAGERMVPTYVQVHGTLDNVGRWVFGFGAGYVTMAFLLTALHTATVPREFLGFTPERPNLLGMAAPDRQWLGFTQYVTEHAFGRQDLAFLMGAPAGTPHAFDAPYHQIGEGSSITNTVWPSFPIRYAMRREQFAFNVQPLQPGVPVPGNPLQGGPVQAPVVRPPAGGGAAPAF